MKRAFNSIQQRLGISLFALLVFAGVLLAQISLWLFDQGLRRYLENNLRDETEVLVSALARGTNGIEMDQRRISASYNRPFSGHYFSIDLNKQRWRSRSSWDFALPEPAQPGLLNKLADGPQAQQLLVYRADYRRFGQSILIVVAQDYTPMLNSLRRLQWIVGGLGLVALILLLLLQRYLVAHALRPLENARVQIAQLQLGQRSSLDGEVPQELQPLVLQINRLLQHTEDTLTRSRNALGNLGHALKTPLAILFSLANRQELTAYPELHEQLCSQLAHMRERISRELGRARLAGEALPGAYFDCAAEIPDLVNTLVQIHGTNLQITWAAPESLRLPWDREDILELLGNLLDNACKWANQKVTLDIRQNDNNFVLTIDDDGPGIAPELRAQVIQRGVRTDEQVQGHGLGLGIARDIVEHCKGTLELQSSPLSGLRVVIHLPASTS